MRIISHLIIYTDQNDNPIEGYNGSDVPLYSDLRKRYGGSLFFAAVFCLAFAFFIPIP